MVVASFSVYLNAIKVSRIVKCGMARIEQMVCRCESITLDVIDPIANVSRGGKVAAECGPDSLLAAPFRLWVPFHPQHTAGIGWKWRKVMVVKNQGKDKKWKLTFPSQCCVLSLSLCVVSFFLCVECEHLACVVYAAPLQRCKCMLHLHSGTSQL